MRKNYSSSSLRETGFYSLIEIMNETVSSSESSGSGSGSCPDGSEETDEEVSSS